MLISFIQAGTDSCSDKTPRYRFWVEDYWSGDPGASYLGPSITGGQLAYESTTYNHNGTCTFFLENVTTGHYYSTNYSCSHPGVYQSDFILERIGLHYLPSFGAVHQTSNYMQHGSSSWELSANHSDKYIMTSDCTASGTLLAEPGPISSGDFSNFHYADLPWDGC